MIDGNGRVGVFWGVQIGGEMLEPLVASCPLSQAEAYGDCLTFGEGHDAIWSGWRTDVATHASARIRAFVRNHEYDEVPRGRVVAHLPTNRFWIYADRRLQGAAFISQIVLRFSLAGENVDLRSDAHYR